MIRCLLNDCRKILGSFPFWAGVLICTILYFTAPLYTDLERVSYSVFECILKFDRQAMEGVFEFDYAYVLEMGTGSWLSLFVPMIAGLASVYVITDEKTSGELRYIIMRTGKTCYYMSKGLVSFLSGGLTIAFGYVLFGIVCRFFFPVSEIDFVSVMKEVIESFMNGAVWGMTVYLFLTVSCNKYIVLSSAFITKYILSQSHMKLFDFVIETENERLLTLTELLDPSAMSQLFSYPNKGLVLGIHLGSVLLIFVLYFMCARRRFDAGM